ncbi:hypothetical protein [Candidatus Tisiphia endosymbiont of Parasteatoda lunata]|uniref:hypothetical protein n=1 Tax=Candidatus Tisiphia endosymbiont of Parasteatoda lunata TaxID=3066275 RepID=UPI00313E5F97
MRLEKWLELQQMQIHIFAKRIGKNRSQVHKYIHEDVMPMHDVIIKIYIATLGAVSANDFHRLSDKLFEKEKLHANSFHND